MIEFAIAMCIVNGAFLILLWIRFEIKTDDMKIDIKFTEAKAKKAGSMSFYVPGKITHDGWGLPVAVKHQVPYSEVITKLAEAVGYELVLKPSTEPSLTFKKTKKGRGKNDS